MFQWTHPLGGERTMWESSILRLTHPVQTTSVASTPQDVSVWPWARAITHQSSSNLRLCGDRSSCRVLTPFSTSASTVLTSSKLRFWHALKVQINKEKTFRQESWTVICRLTIEKSFFFWFCRTWTKRYLITSVVYPANAFWLSSARWLGTAWFKSDKTKKKDFSGWRPAIAFLYFFLFHSLPLSYFLSFSIQKWLPKKFVSSPPKDKVVRLWSTQQPAVLTAKRLFECIWPCTDRKCHVALKQRKALKLRSETHPYLTIKASISAPQCSKFMQRSAWLALAKVPRHGFDFRVSASLKSQWQLLIAEANEQEWSLLMWCKRIWCQHIEQVWML